MIVQRFTFTRPDGSQALVEVWSDGGATLAERPDKDAVWSPAVDNESRFAHQIHFFDQGDTCWVCNVKKEDP